VIVLAFDTATPSTVVAVGLGDGRVAAARHDPGPGGRPEHGSRLLAYVDGVMREAGIGWSDVDRIAAGAGPGGFTGLRLGIATARALAQASRIELATVSTLEALAVGDALPVIDARRREVFTLLDGPVAIAPADLAAHADGRLAVGDGAVRYRDVLAGARIPPDHDPRHLVQPARLCELAALAVPVERDAVLPHYIRDPDAVPRQP